MKKILPFIFLFVIAIIEFFIFQKIFQKNEIFTTIPSDKNIFTQGIFVKNGEIFMSSGAPKNFPNTNSLVGILDKNGNFEKKFEIDKNIFFGEGITELNEKIYFVTWKNQKGFILNAKNFEKIREFSYKNAEGWGLASDGKNIFMSDGTEKITIFDENFEKIGEFSVTENNQNVTKINELEYIDGFIFANIWLTNDIIKINPHSGKVEKRWNFDFLAQIEKEKNPIRQEMNGIGWNAETEEILITGKMWENIYIFQKKYFD